MKLYISDVHLEKETARVKIDTVVIQPTPFCNLNCCYCYLPYRLNTKRIRTEVLTQIFQLVLPSRFVSRDITILWHAGEPLILPISFYREAFELQQRWNTQGVRIVNSLQTNATLINQAWCDFFKDYNVRVGVSLDGPEHIHNANRVDRAGRGSFQSALRGVELLRENEIEYGVIAVITNESVQYPDAIWQFFTELQPARLGFNPEEVTGANLHSTLQTGAMIERYRAFFSRILTLSIESEQPVIIREVENMFSALFDSQSPRRFVTNVALKYLNFDCNGNISTFSPELLSTGHQVDNAFVFGNVAHSSLDDVLMHPKFTEINTQIERGVEMCRETCDYFLFCGGGCPSNKLFENGTFSSTETNACRLHVKVPVDVLLGRLEEVYQVRPFSSLEG